MDGTANGRIKCTLANWTGVVYKIPRTELEKCRSRDDLSQSGVYFLFGTAEDTGNPVVYIGQAGARKNGEGILYRLMEHKRNPGKDYWTEAIVFTTSNNSFGPTEISYLENRFCNLALSAGRYAVKNGNDPNPGHITEEKESELEEFVEYARLAIGTLGHKVFESLIIPVVPYIPVKPAASPAVQVDAAAADGIAAGGSTSNPSTISTAGNAMIEKRVTTATGAGASGFDVPTGSAVVFELKQRTVNARGQRTSDGFVVLKGSKISVQTYISCQESVKRARERYKQLYDHDGVTQADILLRSPNEAAGFVTGTSINAQIAWKTPGGMTLKDVEAAESSTR